MTVLSSLARFVRGETTIPPLDALQAQKVERTKTLELDEIAYRRATLQAHSGVPADEAAKAAAKDRRDQARARLEEIDDAIKAAQELADERARERKAAEDAAKRDEALAALKVRTAEGAELAKLAEAFAASAARYAAANDALGKSLPPLKGYFANAGLTSATAVRRALGAELMRLAVPLELPTGMGTLAARAPDAVSLRKLLVDADTYVMRSLKAFVSK